MASWAMRVGWVLILSFGPSKWRQKNNKNKKLRSHRRPPNNILHATTNQKHVDAMKEMKEKSLDQGGVRWKYGTIILGMIKLGGGKNPQK
jgi:hypothetical protein